MRRTRWLRPLSLLAASLLGSPAAQAITMCPIDDFESGSFDFLASSFQQHTVAIPAYASHAVTSTRTIELQPNGGTVHARLAAGSTLDDFAQITLGASGTCEISWEWGYPVDLTFGGTVDRIDMRVTGPLGSMVICSIADSGGSTGVARWLGRAVGAQTLSWPLAQFAGSQLVDITRATRLEMLFFASSFPGDYGVRDIRLHAAGSGPVDFVGNFVATQTPPTPTPPLSFEIRDFFTASAIYQADVRIANALMDTQVVPAADWTLAEAGGQSGDVAQMSLLWTQDGGIRETAFDIQVDVSGLATELADLYPPDPIHTAESIRLAFPVVARDAQGAATGVSWTWLTVDFDERQLGSLEFHDVAVTENAAARSWTDGFTLSFRMAFSGFGSADEAYPLFHATWMSDWTAQVPTGVQVTTPSAGDGELELVAAPSVTASGTELRASRPYPQAAEVRIHDVSGRLVRTLRPTAGSYAAPWDGRGDDGTATPAGIYFARLSGHGGPGVRVIRVR